MCSVNYLRLQIVRWAQVKQPLDPLLTSLTNGINDKHAQVLNNTVVDFRALNNRHGTEEALPLSTLQVVLYYFVNKLSQTSLC